MSTTTTLREDAKFLLALKPIMPNDHKSNRLDEIAARLQLFADASFEPSLRLESRVEETLSFFAEGWAEHPYSAKFGEAGGIMAALWLLQRRVKAAGNKSLIGGGLSGLGVAAIASIFGGGDKATGEST